MDDLPLILAYPARELHLDGHSVDSAPKLEIRTLTRVVLEALVARGVLDGPADLDC